MVSSGGQETLEKVLKICYDEMICLKDLNTITYFFWNLKPYFFGYNFRDLWTRKSKIFS